MNISFICQQAVSRKFTLPETVWNLKATPENPLNWTINFEVVEQPFSASIAGLKGRNITVGAFEHVDDEEDMYSADRWPQYIKATGSAEVEQNWLQDGQALRLVRQLLWLPESRFLLADQRSSVLGYRREFYHCPIFDIIGNRRPSPCNDYMPTEIGEPLGPGYATLTNINDEQIKNELVWSELLKFRSRTTFEQDKQKLLSLIDARVRRFNSHNEIRDAQKYVKQADRKAAVRAAASAVEACIKHCTEANFIKFPKNPTLRFDQKIGAALTLANLPDFTSLEPIDARNILYLYRARNSMHEGDCYYNDLTNKRIDIVRIDQVIPLVESARKFIFWMDTVI
jgi:hypothetical protein